MNDIDIKEIRVNLGFHKKSLRKWSAFHPARFKIGNQVVKYQTQNTQFCVVFCLKNQCHDLISCNVHDNKV